MARPTAYDPAYAAMVLNHLAAGGTFSGFAASIGVSHQTLLNWRATRPEFAQSIKAAETIRKNPPKPAVQMRSTPIAISLARWGVPARHLHADGVRITRLTEDDIDDMLARAA